MSKNKNNTVIVVIGIVLLVPIFLGIWFDYVDPPFISNSAYDFLIIKLLPALAGLTSLWYFIASYKKYHRCDDYKRTMKNKFAEQGKFRSIVGIIVFPLIMYGFMWVTFMTPIQLGTYYWGNTAWSQTYALESIKPCNSDYGRECTRIRLVDITTGKKHSIRWYDDKKELLKIQEKNIKLIGQQGYFGYIVNGLEW